jgi:ankyrin repeat protein
MRAALNGHLEVVKALLEAGASPLIRQRKKQSLTAREMAESKIKFWHDLKNETRQQVYEQIRSVLIDAEKTVR